MKKWVTRQLNKENAVAISQRYDLPMLIAMLLDIRGITAEEQIAAFADNHLFISKSVYDDRTYTKVTSLDEDGRVQELARIVGGESITDSALNHARQLLEAAHT